MAINAIRLLSSVVEDNCPCCSRPLIIFAVNADIIDGTANNWAGTYVIDHLLSYKKHALVHNALGLFLRNLIEA